MRKAKFINVIVAVIFGLTALSVISLYSQNRLEQIEQKDIIRKKVVINDAVVRAEIAATPENRTKGLSGRPSLKENEGMLFVFDKPGFYSFWMKDMNFPIDIIWISEEMKIIDITKNAKPESFPETFFSRNTAKYVLEVASGWADGNSIKEGQIAKF